jgi:hypothetical protein
LDGAFLKGAANVGKKSLAPKSRKGLLVKGASRPLPIELLEEQSFRVGLHEIMKHYAGLYVLYKKNRLYYIGLANNLFWRLHSHTRNRHKGKWDRFAIFRVDRVRYLKDIESLLLQVARPPGNAVGGHFHRDGDFTKVLRRIQSEQLRTLQRIRKVLK